MEAAARAAGIADAEEPTIAEPIRSHNDEEGGFRRPSVNNSRASLPLSHRRSFSTGTSRLRANSGNEGQAPSTVDGGEEEEEHNPEDVEWGPGHPCYPHLNPHVPRSSPLYLSTRIIRIKRDWLIAGDLAPTYSDLYPEILDTCLPEIRFRELINHINGEMVRIFNPYSTRAWIDAGMGLITGWLWDDLGLTGAKHELAALERWVSDWNKDAGDARIIPLRRSAYLCLDIQIPDPQISPDDYEPTEPDMRSVADTKTTKSASTRYKTGSGRRDRTSAITNSFYSSNASSVGRPTDDAAYGAYPVVPPIPGKYLEAQQQGSKPTKERQSLDRSVANNAVDVDPQAKAKMPPGGS